MQLIAKHNLKNSDLSQSKSYLSHLFCCHCRGKHMKLCWNWHTLMLKISQIQTLTQKWDFFQTTFELIVWIQTFAENSDQSGRPEWANWRFSPRKIKRWYLSNYSSKGKNKLGKQKAPAIVAFYCAAKIWDSSGLWFLLRMISESNHNAHQLLFYKIYLET